MASWLAVALYAAQLFVSPPVTNAQVASGVCASNYTWAENSLHQNPCVVASYLLSTCNGGQYNISALQPGYHYLPPTQATQNPCQCSTVTYSLVSACADCQGGPFTSWSTWTFNCTNVFVQQFPNNIPSGTAVPGWAYLDVKSVDDYNATTAKAATDVPESKAVPKPTGTIQSSSAYSSPTSGSSTASSAGPSSSNHSSNAGAIAGGVVGGLVALALIAGLILFFYLRRRRAQKAPSQNYLNDPMIAPAPAFVNHGAPSFSSSSGAFTNQTVQKLYDPSDPSTFPSSPAQSDMYTTYSSGNHGFTNANSNTHASGHYAGAPEL